MSLCRWTAEAAGLPVLVGPVEATASATSSTQAIALGELGSLEEAREVVRASFEPNIWEPSSSTAWLEAAERFADLTEPNGGAARERELHRGRRSAAWLRPRTAGTPMPPRDLSTLDELAIAPTCSAPTARSRTSAAATPPRKASTVDHAGPRDRTLWVKGSGTDLATITAAGFAALRLDEVLPLRERGTMDDAEMVDYLRRCGLVPDQPRPSIETLLHAFVAAAQVDHAHPDAIIALTSSPDGRALADAAFGDEAVWLDYQRPGFDMSRRIAELLEENPGARAVLLAKHGLVTWGETGEESYRATIEFVTRAAEAIDGAAKHGYGLGGPRVRRVRQEEADGPARADAALAARRAHGRRALSWRSTAAQRRSRSRPRPARPRSARSAHRAPTT